MKEIYPETIGLLTEVGKSTLDDASIMSLLHPIRKQDFINRLHGDTWKRVSQDLETNELIALVRGLTLAEQLLRWSGGSVSAVIWTYREVEKRDKGAAERLADWVLQQTSNPYTPFGHHNYGAKSLSEYQLLSTKHRNKINAGIQIQKESEEQAKESKIKRASQRNYSANLRNTQIRENFIKHFSKKNLTEQLTQLANDQEFSVEFYPTKIASQTKPDFMVTLDEKLQVALLEKLKGKHKGPWGKFKRNLLDIYRKKNGWRSTPWDRTPWFY